MMQCSCVCRQGVKVFPCPFSIANGYCFTGPLLLGPIKSFTSWGCCSRISSPVPLLMIFCQPFEQVHLDSLSPGRSRVGTFSLGAALGFNCFLSYSSFRRQPSAAALRETYARVAAGAAAAAAAPGPSSHRLARSSGAKPRLQFYVQGRPVPHQMSIFQALSTASGDRAAGLGAEVGVWDDASGLPRRPRRLWDDENILTYSRWVQSCDSIFRGPKAGAVGGRSNWAA